MPQTLESARSLLFVPGDRPERFEKAVTSGADAVVLDLEDAVSAQRKELAREAVDRFLASGGVGVVRINAGETQWCAEDLAMAGRRRCAVMVPKATPGQLESVAARLPAGTPLIALVETAAGVQEIRGVCSALGVIRAAFGSIDLAAELGVDPEDDDALRYARGAVVMGSAAAGIAAPLDGVTTVVDDDATLGADTSRAARLGFGGKLCIHPRQVAVVNALFSPTAEELAWARSVVEAAAGGGACVVNGRMVDKPVVERALQIVRRVEGRPASVG